jgi:hypothetical protein
MVNSKAMTRYDGKRKNLNSPRKRITLMIIFENTTKERDSRSFCLILKTNFSLSHRSRNGGLERTQDFLFFFFFSRCTKFLSVTSSIHCVSFSLSLSLSKRIEIKKYQRGRNIDKATKVLTATNSQKSRDESFLLTK